MAEKKTVKKGEAKPAVARGAVGGSAVRAKAKPERTDASEHADTLRSATPASPRKSVKKTTAVRKTVAKKSTAAPAAAVTTVTPAAPIRKTISKRTTVRKAAASAAPAAGGAPKSGRRTKVGMVVSAKSLKTVIVDVERMRQHPLYRKALRVGTRYAAHTENGEVLAGDLVRIQESRPYSATKRWKVIEVLSRAGEAGAAAPRVADVESQLEQQEGVTELLSKPVESTSDGAGATSQAGEKSPTGDTEDSTDEADRA